MRGIDHGRSRQHSAGTGVLYADLLGVGDATMAEEPHRGVGTSETLVGGVIRGSREEGPQVPL